MVSKTVWVPDNLDKLAERLCHKHRVSYSALVTIGLTCLTAGVELDKKLVHALKMVNQEVIKYE